MSPLPSKSLIWSHEPITSPQEIAAIGNFHQLPDATQCWSRVLHNQSAGDNLSARFRTHSCDVGQSCLIRAVGRLSR